MSTFRLTNAHATAVLFVGMLLSLALSACSTDDESRQGRAASPGQPQAEASEPPAAQPASEPQQQTQVEAASTPEAAAQQAQEQQEAMQEEAAEQQQEAEHIEQQAVPETDGARPSVSPSEVLFEDYEDSVWALTEVDDTVTFALDADQASYALALSYVQHGYGVDPASVRPEEWINAHYYAYPFPDGDNEFGITLDLIDHPLDPDRLHLLRIGLQAPVIEQRRQVNVTLVVDASGSMVEGDRVAIAGEALRTILASLKPGLDWAGIIQFSVDPIPSSFVPHTRPDSEFLQASIDRLLPYYGTNVQAGLNLGVQLASDAREAWPEADNYVVLISDGVANVDATQPFAILETALDTDESNPLRLITIGVGLGQYNDVLLEQLAQYGNSWYYYLNSVEEASATFAGENWLRLSTPFADQTRAQLRWNAGAVRSWRLIGYENRRARDESFTEDRKEFAELQSGAAVSIFVELELTEGAQASIDGTVSLGDLEVRWLTPRSHESNRQESPLAVRVESDPDPHLQLGAVVALAADRYGSLEYVGEPATSEVHAALEHLLALLGNIDWTQDGIDGRTSDLFGLLEALAAETSE